MKVNIWNDERYPDYGLSREPTALIEVSDEFLAEYDAVNKAYDDMQLRLRELMKQQRRVERAA